MKRKSCRKNSNMKVKENVENDRKPGKTTEKQPTKTAN